MLEKFSALQPRALSHIFARTSAEALDMMRCCLCFNPNKRITAEKALAHPYVAKFHKTEEEPVCPSPIELRVDDNKKWVSYTSNSR